MKRSHVITFGFPDTLAARLLKKANPDHHIIAIGPKGMPGPHAVQRQIEKKTIDLAVIDPAIEKDHRNMMIKTIDCTPLRKRDGLCSGSRIIHSVSVPPPPGSRRCQPNGFAQVGPQAPPTAAAASAMIARRPPRAPPMDYLDNPSAEPAKSRCRLSR
jgi:hypothetical protein